MEDKIDLWVRLGATVSVTSKQLQELKKGNQDSLLSLIDTGAVMLDGESYFPSNRQNEPLNGDSNEIEIQINSTKIKLF